MKMLDRIEFYNCPDGAVCVKEPGKAVYEYSQSCRRLTEEMMSSIRELYPDAYKTLAELYSKNERNRDFYEYNIVHRFIRCNFGEYDALNYDIDKGGRFHFEDVRCPLRGECRHEGVICKPKMKTALSPRESEVAQLLGQGLSRQEIADELYISICTVARLIDNIKNRLDIKTTAQIVSRFSKDD